MDTLPSFTGALWLDDLLRFSAAKDVCVSWGCTTCGAMPFRNALAQGAAAVAGHDDRDADAEIARQLSTVEVDARSFHTVRFVILFLYYLRGRSSDFEMTLLPLFKASPAGAAYEAMTAHYAALLVGRDPKLGTEQDDRSARLKDERMRARKSRKQEIDAAWVARGKQPPATRSTTPDDVES